VRITKSSEIEFYYISRAWFSYANSQTAVESHPPKSLSALFSGYIQGELGIPPLLEVNDVRVYYLAAVALQMCVQLLFSVRITFLCVQSLHM
jgi:hypothetical protein